VVVNGFVLQVMVKAVTMVVWLGNWEATVVMGRQGVMVVIWVFGLWC
jgi:hypothetical protein